MKLCLEGNTSPNTSAEMKKGFQWLTSTSDSWNWGKGMKPKVSRRSEMKSLSCVWLFVTPWTVACQAPPSMRCSKQECWSGLPFPSPEDLLNPGLLHCRQMLYHLSHQGNYNHLHCKQKKGNNKDQNGNYWNEGWGWKKLVKKINKIRLVCRIYKEQLPVKNKLINSPIKKQAGFPWWLSW